MQGENNSATLLRNVGYTARRSVRDLPASIERMTARLAALTADRATSDTHADDGMSIHNRRVPHGQEMAILGQALDALPWRVMQSQRVPLGTYRGLRFGLVLHPQWAPELFLEGAGTRQDALSREHHGPRAILKALDRLTAGYAPEIARTRQDLTVAEGQLRDYRERLGKPFPHAQYLEQLVTLRDKLKAGLADVQPEQGKESGPSVSELAEQIKALRSRHTVEAAPERAAKRQVAAEEPVTTRIRRRAEANPASEGAWQRRLAEETAAGRVMEPG